MGLPDGNTRVESTKERTRTVRVEIRPPSPSYVSRTPPHQLEQSLIDCVWNVTAHAQKPEFVFRRNGRVHLNRRGRQFSRLLAAEVWVSAVVMLDTPCSEIVWRVLATDSIRQFPFHFPSLASPCTITFQLDCTSSKKMTRHKLGMRTGRSPVQGEWQEW
jgi:hypothetical protein